MSRIRLHLLSSSNVTDPVGLVVVKGGKPDKWDPFLLCVFDLLSKFLGAGEYLCRDPALSQVIGNLHGLLPGLFCVQSDQHTGRSGTK